MNLAEMRMTPDEQAALQPVADRLVRLVSVSTTNLVHDAAYDPAPNSRIAKAMAGKLRDPYEQAGQRLMSAEDHLRTVLTVLTSDAPLPGFSLFTLVRGAAVPAVHARHLLDPSITEGQRLGRGLNARLENLEQQQKVHPEIQGNHFDERLEHLRSRADANGVAVIRNRNGTIIAFGESQPSDTDLFERYLPEVGKTYFQYLSGYAHSLPWAQLPRHRAEPSADPEISLVRTDVNVPVFAAVLNGALNLYDETVEFWLGHAGFPSQVWTMAKGA
jgi:hypothetical protein